MPERPASTSCTGWAAGIWSERSRATADVARWTEKESQLQAQCRR